MSERDTHEKTHEEPVDAVEHAARQAHYVLPLVGAALMFLLAFIAIYLA